MEKPLYRGRASLQLSGVVYINCITEVSARAPQRARARGQHYHCTAGPLPARARSACREEEKDWEGVIMLYML